MQFLYADGADAHFMDTRVLRADRGRRGDGRGRAALDHAEQRGRGAVHRRRALRRAAAERRRPGGDRDRARDCAATRSRAAAPSRRRSRPARRSRCRCSSSTGDAHPRRHALRRLRRRAPEMRRTDQRRAAVVALYQHDLTGPAAGGDARAERVAVRARARARGGRPRGGARRADRPPRPRLVGGAHPAARAPHHARRADRDAAPRRRAGGRADPAGGGDRRGRREREDVLRRGRARLRQRGARRGPARGARECAASHEQRGAHSTS